MRNLQKILALVLALVMSLSLMATAGATDFSDDAEIDETFRESVDVLNGLKVFQGYDNGAYFSPKGDITRAEVAAIIYRIATGDVTDSQVKIYADYNKFSDVPSDHWAAGYINYCTNAEYIKGRGDGKFYPSDKVTGYEALAMILRVVGYDKNGEFTGADWQVQTAATANQRKVTKNVNAGTLGTPASRETVAELLCQAILIEKVNYTLAFGYQISTDPKDTIAYETFQMERLTGVVTGNEIADLKETSPMAAGQTRMVIDGEERVLNVVSGLEDIGKSVRMYVRPQSGTTRYDMVTDDVYATELNKVYDSFAGVSSVGNSTGSAEGITSIAGAEHYINYDYVTRWTARMRITYVMDLKWTEYQAFSMRKDNGGKLYAYRPADMANPGNEVSFGDDRSQWNTRLPHDGYTFTYVKTIALDDELTSQDWENLKTLFTNADKTGTSIVMGEVYVGTASFNNAQKDVSDEIRWEDFVATYLKNEETRQQVESNRLGDRLIIVDNDNDGIAEYVLQTRYTIAKVVPNGSKLTLGAVESKFDDTNDRVNIITASDELVSVSGKELAASEEALATGDVVIYALIDGNIRAQKAETETARITAINRGTTTVTYEGGEKKQSGVHPHAEGLTNGVDKMVIGTNYTMYFDLDGNLAAFTEGNVGSFVLITDGWYNQAVNAREYAVQAYIDGRLQTVNVTNNGSYFIGQQQNNNNWGNLKDFGENGALNNDRTNGHAVKTTVATLEDGNLIPVDKSYRVSQNVVMLDMDDNKIPTRDGINTADVYTTDYQQSTAYMVKNNQKTPLVSNAQVLGRADTVYYYVHNLGNDDNSTNLNGQKNYVVRTYTGYNNIPAIDPSYIEDVYAVGIQAGATTPTDPNATYYTAEVVVVELNEKYLESRTASEQVFIPATSFVSGGIAGAGIETVNMIRGNGEYEENVLVDMRQSTLRYYDITNSSLSTSRSYAGLYFMDPVGTNADGKVIYKIENMDRAAIRSNNYLAGYVSQTNVTNDHVRVDGMTISNANKDACGTDIHYPVVADGIVGLQGATINSGSKLYKLGYSSNGVPNLNSSLSAAEVFYRNPDPNVSDLGNCWLNEMWDGADNHRANTSRNEVLVRYDNSGNVIWAISFNEFRSVSGNVGTRDLAQDVWYQMLPAKEQDTKKTTFWGVADNETGKDTTPADGLITISHKTAVDNKAKGFHVIDVTSISGTVNNYKLEKWNATNSTWNEIPRDLINAEEIDTAEQRYQLTIYLNQGEPIIYTLVKQPANQTAQLVMKDNTNGGTAAQGYVGTIDQTNKTVAVNAEAQTMLISAFIDKFMANTDIKGDIEWKFYNRIGTGEIIPRADWSQTQMTDVSYFEAVITPEDGLPVIYRMTGVTAGAGLSAKKIAAKAAAKAQYDALPAEARDNQTVIDAYDDLCTAIDDAATETDLSAIYDGTNFAGDKWDAYEDAVDNIGTTLPNAKDGVITLTCDVDVTENGTPEVYGVDMKVIDLAGHTLSATGMEVLKVCYDADVTIKNGTIKRTGNGAGDGKFNGALAVSGLSTMKVNLEDVDIVAENCSYGISAYAGIIGGNDDGNGTLNMTNGSSITCTNGTGVWVQGDLEGNDLRLNFNNTTIKATNALYLSGDATTKLDNCVVEGTAIGVMINSKNVTILRGSVAAPVAIRVGPGYASAPTSLAVRVIASSTTLNGDIEIAERDSTDKSVTIDTTGTTVNGAVVNNNTTNTTLIPTP